MKLITELHSHFDNYLAWLKDQTVFSELDNGAVEITAPYLDRHNDYLQFYVLRNEQGLFFTDDGYILNDLAMSGVEFNTPKRKKLLTEVANGFGVQIKDGQLTTLANKNNFAVRKNSFIQAMLAINDMFSLANASVASFFFEDVEAWLTQHNIRYLSNVNLSGKSGFTFNFDFAIPKSSQSPERLLHTINNPVKNNIEHILFGWSDTKEARGADTTLYVALNDINHRISDSTMQSLRNYNINPILWSKKDKAISQLIN